MASIQDVRAISTPQKSYMWEVSINGLSTGGLDNMSFFAKTISLPQTAVEQIIINHKAGKSHFVGRDASSHTVNITFFDDEALSITKYFNSWMDDLIMNQTTGGSTPRDIHSADLVIDLKDSTDENVTGSFKLTKAWPMEISEVPLSYDGSEPIELSVTLSFDEKSIS